MGSKYTKRYTEEFKRDAIALVDSSDKTVTAVARELGISSESLRGWYRRAKAGRGEDAPRELTSAERDELRRLGRRVNRKRIARVTRERDIRGVTRRRHRSLTRPDAKAKPAPDLIGRDFHAARPGTRLVGDITYLPTAEGWLHLARWLDLATREVVGYAMADHHRAELVVDALDMAHGRGGLEPGCVIHSDCGSEYTSAQFAHRITELGLRQSCGRTGSCSDNAAAESFRTLLKEEIGTRTWPDRATARAEVFTFIETFYNRRRLRKHKTFGYLTPAETRQRRQNTLAA